jgi:hypothetical protein
MKTLVVEVGTPTDAADCPEVVAVYRNLPRGASATAKDRLEYSKKIGKNAQRRHKRAKWPVPPRK